MANSTAMLAEVPLFAGLDQALLDRVQSAMTVRRYRRGMYVFAEGEPAEAVHFVLTGRVRVFRDTPDGHEQTLQVFDAGGLLAMACLVEGQPYPASAQAMADSSVASIRLPDFGRLAQSHGELAWRLVLQFARRLLWAQGRIYDLALRSAAGRVAAALLQFGREQGQSTPDGQITIDLPLTHRELGQLTGVSRETVTRTLRQLRESGALRWTEDGLLVLDAEALAHWTDP